jgi:hypothetical protein
MKTATISFPAGKVVYELLDTPITEIWVNTLKVWQENNMPMATQKGSLLYNGGPHYRNRNIENEQQWVDEINSAIEDFNSLTTGMRFPYQAWVDMPWSQTNLIHRCFTLGMGSRSNIEGDTSGGILQHHMTDTQLHEYKKWCYDDKSKVFEWEEPQFFFNSKYHSQLDDIFERINHGVHHYENMRFSQCANKFLEEECPTYLRENNLPGHVGTEINLTWDVYTDTGNKSFFHREEPTWEQVEASIPENWMEYDLFCIKSITGKDYETGFQNYDNPLEYDIQNIQDVTGGVRMFPNNGHKVLYGDSSFGNYLRGYGLTYKQYAPVPLGKLVSADFDLNNISSHETDKNSDGSSATEEQYRNPKITIDEVSSMVHII